MKPTSTYIVSPDVSDPPESGCDFIAAGVVRESTADEGGRAADGPPERGRHNVVSRACRSVLEAAGSGRFAARIERRSARVTAPFLRRRGRRYVSETDRALPRASDEEVDVGRRIRADHAWNADGRIAAL